MANTPQFQLHTAAAAAARDTPPGCWVIDDGTEVRVGASSANWIHACYALCFALFWNIAIGHFVVRLVSETILALGGQIPIGWPRWHSSPGPMPPSDLIGLWLFKAPFVLIGIGLVAYFAMLAAGRVEVTLRAGRGLLFTGVGPVGRTRHFDPSRVRTVSIRSKAMPIEMGATIYNTEVIIEADKPLRFGGILSRLRQRFLLDSLSSLLTPQPVNQHSIP